MSVLEWLLEGLLLVLVLYSFWLHIKANRVIDKVDARADQAGRFLDESLPGVRSIMTNLTGMMGNAEGKMVYYETAMDEILTRVNKQLEIPISEHMFHTLMNALISLGAGEMSKEDKAKQTMALIGFQNIGRHVAKGIKHEIPAVEMLNQYSETAQSAPGGFAVESILGQVLGIDLPPGAIAQISAGSQKKQVKQNVSNADFHY